MRERERLHSAYLGRVGEASRVLSVETDVLETDSLNLDLVVR